MTVGQTKNRSDALMAEIEARNRLRREGERALLDGLGGFAKAVSKSAMSSNGQITPQQILNVGPSLFGSESTGEDGGFAVPPDVRAGIVQTVMGEDSLLARCNVVRTNSNQLAVPVDETTPWQSTGGIQAGWATEMSQLAQSKPELQMRDLRLEKLTAILPASSELLEDSPSLGNYLASRTAMKLDYLITRTILAGTGIGTPSGILPSPATIIVAEDAAQAAATMTFSNVQGMWNRLYSQSQLNAVWIANPDAIASLLENASVNSRQPVYLPPGLSGSRYATLMGAPIILSEACEALGTPGDLILADLSQYLVALRRVPGASDDAVIRQDVSMHLWFDVDTSAFKFIMRIGGMPWRATQIKRRLGGGTVSPFIVLAQRA